MAKLEDVLVPDIGDFVGVEVAQLKDLPLEVAVKMLPATQYAVFTLKGQEITSDWAKMIYEWMPESGYQEAFPFMFQLYDQRFKGLQHLDVSALDAYVPVKQRQDAVGT